MVTKTVQADPEALRHKTYLPALTGVRGVAAILVFWYHARWWAGNPEMRIGAIDFRSVFLAMDSGVGIFFVLSGFLLSRPFWKSCLSPNVHPIALTPYFIRRILRIAPAYYIVLIHTHLFSNLTYTFWGAVSLLLSLLGLHTFLHQSYVWQINPIIWSIGIEVQFYVLLPILFILARMLLAKSRKPAQSGIMTLGIITILCF
jgi:peptidoglycan/LPS O-acetylase OafA/YrhL